MAILSYDQILADLHNQIHEKLERRENAEFRFAKVGTAQEVLHPLNLERLYRSLVPPGTSMEEQFGSGITAKVLISRTKDRHLHDFLATLIYSRCTIASARNFVAELLACSPANWPIYCEGGSQLDELPADRPRLQRLLGIGNVPDINSFIDTQPCFCPIVLLEGKDVQVSEGKKQRLPYVFDEIRIGEGNYGDVYRVVVAIGHMMNKESMANTKPMPIARKDFKKSHDFQREYENMKQILYTPRKSENILETFGSLQLGANTFSLFMPLAKCDLKAWMQDNVPPDLESGKADILKCASGLADGLEFLHSDIRDHNRNHMICYHMDLKPANILVFPDDREHDKLIWKISDFGMSRVKVPRQHANADDRDISALFQRREEMTTSGTANRRFDGSYLAPESTISMRSMNEKSDIWSLGCVISVVLTYLYGGQDGIVNYSEARGDSSMRHGSVNQDRFFLTRNFTNTKTHPAVTTWHQRLTNQVKQRNSAEGTVVKYIVKYLEEKVLVLDPTRRDPAKFISDRLLKASDAYRRLGMDTKDEENDILDRTLIGKLSRLRQRIFPQPIVEVKVEKWPVSDAKAFIGCSVAPNGIFIAYWTSTCIMLYNAHFLPNVGRGISRVAEFKYKGAGTWKSVKLTEKYLIASTTGRHSHFYLFDLNGGNVSGLNFEESYEVAPPIDSFNGLHQIAISPGGEVLACVVPRDSNRSWVFYANIQSLLRHGMRRANFERTSISSNEFQYNINNEEPWNRFSVDATPTSVTHLFFPYDDILCSVAQPEITQHHSVHISCLSLPTRRVSILPVENPLNSSSRDFDSSNSGRLFTTLAAINNERTFAIVLYENQFLVRNLTNTDQKPGRDITFQNYFIIELLMDERHSRLFALGTKSGNGMMLLLELPLPHSGHKDKPSEIKELSDIRHNDRFIARLVNGRMPSSQGAERHAAEYIRGADENGYITISTYNIARPTLYKVGLPKPR